MSKDNVRSRSTRDGFGHRLLLALVVALGISGSVAADTGNQPPSPPAGKQWNHAETQNFVVMAINPEHRDYLAGTMEFLRRWEYDRWGMKQVDFSVKCKVLVASDREEYKRLFSGKDVPTVRVDRDAGGKITALTVWCWADPKWHATVLPRLLTEVCLAEFEQAYSVKFPLWLHRGMAVLNGGIPEIKRELGDLTQIYAQNLPCFWTEDILTMTPEKLAKYQPQNQKWFDKQAAVLCLYVMKGQGQKKFLDFLDASIRSPGAGVPILGYAGYAEFDTAFNKYMYNLSQDVAAGKTATGYLTWDSK